MIRIILFAALLAVPIAEIAVFLAVGSVIGVLPTILIIIATAILGAYLLKAQGMAAFARLRSDINEKRVPAAAIGHALTIGIAGALLLTPGFITDTLGLLLFVPAVRAALWRQISPRIRITPLRTPNRPGPATMHPGQRTIDLEANEVVDPAEPGTPWRGGPR